jgi:hypothetical protein
MMIVQINRHIKRLDDQIAQAIKNVDEATLASAQYDPPTLMSNGKLFVVNMGFKLIISWTSSTKLSTTISAETTRCIS